MFQNNAAFTQTIEKTIKKFASECCSVQDWGSNYEDNDVKAVEIINVIERDKLNFVVLERKWDERRFTFQLTINHKIRSWKQLNRGLYHIIEEVKEKFVFVHEEVDDMYLKYWLITGVLSGPAPHGHIGSLSFKREDIQHLNPSYFTI